MERKITILRTQEIINMINKYRWKEKNHQTIYIIYIQYNLKLMDNMIV